jgi:hypothetical protein
MRRCQVRSGATRASLRRTAPSARECGNPSAQCRAEEVHRPSFVGLALVTGATVCVRAAAVAGVSDHETLPLPRQAVVAGAHHEPRRTFAPRSNQARRWSRPRLLRWTTTSSPRPRQLAAAPSAMQSRASLRQTSASGASRSRRPGWDRLARDCRFAAQAATAHLLGVSCPPHAS